jgi:nitrogen fixation NifU-like protein
MAIDRSTPPLESLYQEVILQHFKSPRNRGQLEGAQHDVQKRNPSCGDEIRLQLKLDDNGRIADVRFTGEGCAISQSSVSMMTQLVKGMSADEVHGLAARFTEMMHGDAEAARDRSLGDLRALAGVSKFPVRVKCALLGWEALEAAIGQSDQ